MSPNQPNNEPPLSTSSATVINKQQIPCNPHSSWLNHPHSSETSRGPPKSPAGGCSTGQYSPWNRRNPWDISITYNRFIHTYIYIWLCMYIICISDVYVDHVYIISVQYIYIYIYTHDVYIYIHIYLYGRHMYHLFSFKPWLPRPGLKISWRAPWSPSASSATGRRTSIPALAPWAWRTPWCGLGGPKPGDLLGTGIF